PYSSRDTEPCRPCRAPGIRRSDRVIETFLGLHFFTLHFFAPTLLTTALQDRVIASRPSLSLETQGFKADERGGDEQRQESPAIKTEHRDVSGHGDAVGDGGMARVGFGLDAQVVVAGGHAGHDHSVIAAA